MEDRTHVSCIINTMTAAELAAQRAVLYLHPGLTGMSWIIRINNALHDWENYRNTIIVTQGERSIVAE